MEHPQQDADATLAVPALNTDVTEVPERPKSPRTPSYSVTTHGSAPVHSDKPLEEVVSERVTDAQHEEVKFEKEEPTETERAQTESTLPPPETVEEHMIKPEGEPSVEHSVEVAESTEPTNAALETSVTEITTADVQEEIPSGEDTASDAAKGVEETKETAEVSVAAPAETETVVEPVVTTGTEDVIPSQEPTPEHVQEKLAVAKDSEAVAQAVEDRKSTRLNSSH